MTKKDKWLKSLTLLLDNKKEVRYLFTDWGFGLSSVKIYDSYESFNLITQREIDKNGCVQWFNIDNIQREIEEYGIKNNIKFKGLGETLRDINENGFSYSDKDKDDTILRVLKQNSNRDKSNRYSKEIKVID